MLQIISPNDSKIILDNTNPEQNINMINKYIKLCNCENMTVDITNLNVIDACMISTLCSTEHYLKYPNGRINWIINSKEVIDYTSCTSLDNTYFELIK